MLRRMRRKKYIIVKTHNDIYLLAITTGADFSDLLLPFPLPLPLPFPLCFGGLLKLLLFILLNFKTIIDVDSIRRMNNNEEARKRDDVYII